VPIIHFSTDYVFDGTGSRPWREEYPANPLSIYGASKFAGDKAVCAARGTHLIVRTSWVYAAEGTNFLRTIVRLARERGELRIVVDQVGAPTSARMIATAVADIVGTDEKQLADRFAAAEGVVNLAASGEASWYEFAIAIIAGLRARGITLAAERIVPIASKDYPTKAKRPANCRLDLTRLRLVFGINPLKWDQAMAIELDQVATELSRSKWSSGLTPAAFTSGLSFR
jgi:dTDP-4-dehydrorhamnose reductase